MEVKLRTVTGQTLVVHDVQDGMTTDDLKVRVSVAPPPPRRSS